MVAETEVLRVSQEQAEEKALLGRGLATHTSVTLHQSSPPICFE